MRLIQAKVRCVRGVADSGWFTAGKTTLIHGPAESVTALLTALTALNPRLDLDEALPFAGHPRVWRQRGFARPVIAAKKTAVYMIFAADPGEVRELGAIDPDLFETDRLEVGRRLDHSRWLSFVEISESGRWREIAEDMQYLAQAAGAESTAHFTIFAAGLRGADRLKGRLGEECCALLAELEQRVGVSDHARLAHCRSVAQRYQRFRDAGQCVYEGLPRTLYMAPWAPLPGEYLVGYNRKNGQQPVQQPQALAELIATLQQRAEVQGLTVGDWLEDSGREIASFVDFLREVCWPVPRLGVHGEDLVFHDMPGDPWAQRCYWLALLLMLVRCLGEAPPIVMADGFLLGLERETAMTMVPILQQLYPWGQLIVGGDAAAAGLSGWTGVHEIDLKGRVR